MLLRVDYGIIRICAAAVVVVTVNYCGQGIIIVRIIVTNLMSFEGRAKYSSVVT
jgi:hypothetical protein